jgi:hypothetical protein
MRVVKPFKGAEFPALAIDGSLVIAFFHWFLPHCKLQALGTAQIVAAVSTMLKISSAANDDQSSQFVI